MTLKKFNINDYGLHNIGTVFYLTDSENSNTSYRCTLDIINDTLCVVDSAFNPNPFNLETAPYIKQVVIFVDDAIQRCSVCGNNATNYHMGSPLCARHYKNERVIAEMSIRTFLYRIKTQEQLDILNERFDPWWLNSHDCKIPCHVVILQDDDNQYDIPLYKGLYITQEMTDGEIK